MRVVGGYTGQGRHAIAGVPALSCLPLSRPPAVVVSASVRGDHRNGRGGAQFGWRCPADTLTPGPISFSTATSLTWLPVDDTSRLVAEPSW